MDTKLTDRESVDMPDPSDKPSQRGSPSIDVELRVFYLPHHGNACAFVFPDATLGIVDWGTKDTAPFTSLLGETNASRVRFVVATHAHSDHTKGLEPILRECVQRNVHVDRLFYPATGPVTLGPYDYLNRAAIFAHKNRINIHALSVNDFPQGKVQKPPYIARTDHWEVTILAPPSSTNTSHQLISHLRETNPGNTTSLILLFRYLDNGNAVAGRALLPGDATPALLRFAANLSHHYPELSIDNDAIVVPHHGSRHNWPSWMSQHIRGNAIVSAGPTGRDHPHKDVLTTLARTCAANTDSQLYCTSYCRACRETFAPYPILPSDPLLGEGPCFGDIRVRLSRHGSRVVGHDPLGPDRRPYGFCNHP